MSGAKSKVFYWDSCVYIAWLKEELTHGKQHLDAVAQILHENADRKNIITSSTITLIEVLACRIGDENERLFRRSFQTQDHIAYDVDSAIALKARQLRENCLGHPTGKTLATPDAIHVATALIYKADMLFTFDDGKRNKKYLGLLELNEDDRVDRLKICRPFVENPELFNRA